MQLAITLKTLAQFPQSPFMYASGGDYEKYLALLSASGIPNDMGSTTLLVKFN